MPPTIVRGQWGQWGTGRFYDARWTSPGGAIGIDYGSGPEVVPAGTDLGTYLNAQTNVTTLLSAWTSGGTYDPTRREFRTMATSGHYGHASNEVNVLSWTTGLWNGGAGNPGRPVNPSVGLYRKYTQAWPTGSYYGGTNVATSPPAFWDLSNRYTAGAKVPPGQAHALWPNGRQHYGNLVFMTSLGRYVFWGGTTWWYPSSAYVPFEFDPATNQYDGIIEEPFRPNLTQGMAGCWDSTNTRFLTAAIANLYAYRPTLARGSRTQDITPGSMPYRGESAYSTALWDPFRARMQFVGYAESYYFDFSSGPTTPVKVQPTWTGPGNAFGTSAPLACYDPVSKKYFVWVGGGPAGQCDDTVYWLDPDTFVITAESPPHVTHPTYGRIPQSSGDLGAQVNSGGIWNRGFYEPTDDVFVVVGNIYTQGFDFFAPRRTGANITRLLQDLPMVLDEHLDKTVTLQVSPGAPPIVNINLTQPPGLSASIRRASASGGGVNVRPPMQEPLALQEQPLIGLKIPVPTGIPPVLLFSSIVQGPKTGNSDTSHGLPAGQDGAYVSIFGRRISSTTFSLAINGAAPATILYRGPAIPPYSMATLQNGVQNYEMIVAQVSHLATDGAGSIIATVDGVASNALPFTVAPGQITYCAGTGSTSNPGSWAQPKRLPQECVTSMQPGDIVYCRTGADQPSGVQVPLASHYQTATAPLAIVGYPGHTVQLGSPSVNAFLDGASGTGYWMTYANLRLAGAAGYNVHLHDNSRSVANYFTCPQGTGKAAALGAEGSAVRIYGNEFTQVGLVSDPDPEFHVIYVFGARDRGPGGWWEESDRDIAYNFIHECAGALRAVNIFNGMPGSYGDVGEGSNPISGHKVHDNYIRGQHGSCIAFLKGVVGQNWAWNNVLERNVWTPNSSSVATSTDLAGLEVYAGWDLARYPGTGNVIHAWTNTIVDCGAAGNGNYSGAFDLRFPYGGSWTPDFHSNLSYQVNGQPHVSSQSPVVPTTGQGHHNLWYGAAAPPWPGPAVTGNPLFVAPGSPLNPHLQAGSAARGAGAVLGAGALNALDVDGVPRPTATACDAGAFQYA